jgi:hypothetical protein
MRKGKKRHILVDNQLHTNVYACSIGTARFMKTLRGRHKDGYVVIKLFIKPELGINLATQVEKIKGIRVLT